MPSPLDHSERCVLLNKQKQSDGMGGFIVGWTDGPEFPALISLDSSLQAKIAEQQNVNDLYTVYVQKSFPIEFNDYFRREADGATFKITSSPDEQATPQMSNMDFKVFSAAKSALPK